MRFWTGLLLAAGCSAALTGGGLAGAYHHYVGSYRALPGTWVADQALPETDGEQLGDWLESLRERLRPREVYVELPHGVAAFTLGQLGIELDVGRTMARLEEQRTEGNPIRQVRRAIAAREGELEVEPAWTFDRKRAEQTLEQLRSRVERAPVNAMLDLKNHQRVDDEPGLKLDMTRTLARLASWSPGSDSSPRIELSEVPARVTSEMIARIDVSKVLSVYETSFRDKAGPRAVNIAKAAEYLNGTILAPGETFSFNETVGPRTLERGFTEAPEIVNDELTQGVGGGVCQVATTLHAAGVYGLLDVVRRRSHSRPSGYAPLGLDATVIYGEVDLKLKNPYDTALIVHAFLPSRYVIRIELLGRNSPGEVEHAYAVTERHDFVRRVITKDWMEDQQKRKQKGNYGYDVVSVVRVRLADGRTERRHYRSKYYPVPEIFWVGPNVVESELPELPDGATHTERDGEPMGSAGPGSVFLPDSADMQESGSFETGSSRRKPPSPS